MVQNINSKSKARKEILKKMLEQDKLESIVEERKKSANRRELERYYKEDEESEIKEHLEYARKKRDNDIRFNHNPLDVKNITAGTDWEVLKEKNMFANNKNMFEGQKNIHKSNHNLLNSGNVLHGRSGLFKKNGGCKKW